MTSLRAQFMRPGFRRIGGKNWFARQDYWTDGITFGLDRHPLRIEFPVSRRPEFWSEAISQISRRPFFWPDAPACRQCICSKKRHKKK